MVQDLEEIVPPPEEEKETSKKNPRSSKAEIEQGIHEVSEEIALKEAEVKKAYEFPPMELLKKGKQTGETLILTYGKLPENYRRPYIISA